MDEVTAFAEKVYRIVLRIPAGEVRSYKWVASKAGRPQASRAVGQILRNNPYPLIVPCHRVIKSDDNCGGYVFGEELKKELLDTERRLKDMME